MNPVLFDRMGSVASASCALHCLTFAVAPAVAGALGIGFLANEKVEWTLFAAAIVFALLASGLGFRVHRNRRVLGGFGLGIALLSAARLGEAFHLFPGTLVLAVLGGAALVASHLASSRCVRQCRDASCAASA